MSDNLSSIKKKISALLAKTVENGCTEAEAMTAITMANKLMLEYNVAEFDLTTNDNTFYKVTIRVDGAKVPFIHKIVTTIATLTGTKVWYTRIHQKYNGNSHFLYNFFGMNSDPELAAFVFNHLNFAINNEVKNFKTVGTNSGVHGSTLRSSFAAGIITRLYQRINDMITDNNKVKLTSDSKSLIVVKDQLVNNAYYNETKDMKLKVDQNTKTNIGSGHAFLAGKEAGDKIDINRKGINDNSDNILKIGNK